MERWVIGQIDETLNETDRVIGHLKEKKSLLFILLNDSTACIVYISRSNSWTYRCVISPQAMVSLILSLMTTIRFAMKMHTATCVFSEVRRKRKNQDGKATAEDLKYNLDYSTVAHSHAMAGFQPMVRQN